MHACLVLGITKQFYNNIGLFLLYHRIVLRLDLGKINYLNKLIDIYLQRKTQKVLSNFLQMHMHTNIIQCIHIP